MKYIRTKMLGIVLFCETESHNTMAKILLSPDDEIISAGFANSDDWRDNGQVSCSGYSTTLEVGSKQEDTQIVRVMLKR